MPHPMTALAKPALGATVIDAQFTTTIRRITAVTDHRHRRRDRPDVHDDLRVERGRVAA